MKSKKLLVMALVLLAGSFAFAQYTEGVDFVQYTGNDFNTYRTLNDWNPWPVSNPHPKGWTESHMITLKVQAGSTVYLTNYVSNFNLDGESHIADLGDPSYALGYDMTANHYGYVVANTGENGNVIKDANGNYSINLDHPDSQIQWGNGEKVTVTYTDPDSTATQTTTGYKLGTFNEDTEIFFVMSPNGYEEQVVTSYDLVHDPDGEPEVKQNSIFKSRHVDPNDLAANARVNFAFGDLYSPTGNSHEFVIGYVATSEPPPSGQPLPGVLTSCLIALGATGIAARRRKHSKK